MARVKSPFVRGVAILVAALIAAAPLYASKTAGVIAAVSAIQAGKWGIITAVDPEPATKTICGVITGVYGVISGGAWLYDVIADPVVQGVPSIGAIYEGPAVWRDPGTGELLPPAGAPVSGATAWRVVSIVGQNFSWTSDSLSVSFGGTPAKVLPLSTNTLLMVTVPIPGDGALPASAPVTVTVEGRTGPPFPFTIEPQPGLTGDAGATVARLLAKEKHLLDLIAGADWEQLLDSEAPDLTADERQSALSGADDMHDGATQIRSLIGEWEDLVDHANVDGAFALVVEINPELEALLDAAIDDLVSRGVLTQAQRAQRSLTP